MQDSIHTEETSEVTSDLEDNMEDDIPVILLSKAEKERIHAPWRSALIIKAFGKSVGFKYMDFKTRSLWKLVGDMQCIDLGNDYFLIRFKLEEDYWRVVNGGPWFINQQFLTIRRWSPGFRPSEARISTTAVWARLPELPIELYDMSILRRIGNQLGHLLKVDARTMDNERGRFARLCVQIDLEQPLTSKVRIGDMIQKIQYEGISTICFECGRVGHRIDSCPSKFVPATLASPKTPETNPPSNSDEDSSNYGKWMLVNRRRSATKKTFKKNASILANAPATAYISKQKKSKQSKSTPRGSPLESHKGSVSHLSPHTREDQSNPTKSDQPLSSNHPSSSQNTQPHHHHLVSIDPAHSGIPNTASPLANVNNSPTTRSIPAQDNVSLHTIPPSDHTSNHPLKVNLCLSTDKAPDPPLLPNPNNSDPLISMDLDATELTSSIEPLSHSHQTNTCNRNLPGHGSTSSTLSFEQSNSTEQTSQLKQEPKCSSAQTSPTSTTTPIITHTSTLSFTPTSNSVSGKLGSAQEGSTASHRKSSSEMASGMPNPVLDTSRSRNGTSIKSTNSSSSCEYTVQSDSNKSDLRTSDCVPHNYAHFQRLTSLERTPSSDPRTSTDQENTEWHRDNIRATRCRSPRSHDHSHILGEHPDSHSFPGDGQYHHPGGITSEALVVQTDGRSPPTRNASRTILSRGDEPTRIHKSYSQSGSPEQNLH
ncbi:hypothetical protein FCV25MIE_14833 [Fagus crenata]